MSYENTYTPDGEPVWSKEQRESFLEASKPLIKWMSRNIHPHAKAIVSCTSAEIVEGTLMVGTDEFIGKITQY